MSRPSKEILDRAWELIDGATSVAVLTHANPDGDALGSGLCLTLWLREAGKDAHLLSSQRVPEIYEFLNVQDVIESAPPLSGFDLAILVDCDRPDRVNSFEEVVLSTSKALVLDHHPPTSEFGDVRVVQEDCSAAGEVVYYLLQHRQALITPRMAEALLTAVMTDTGGFRFRNTSPESLEIAAALMRAGTTTADIAEKVYESRSLPGLLLLGRSLESLQLSPSGKVVWAKLSMADFEATGAQPEDTEGFVNIVHGLRGADVAAMLREEGPDSVRVSLRSRGEYAVNKVAQALGGGGHEMAAACVLQMTLREAEIRVLDELKRWTDF